MKKASCALLSISLFLLFVPPSLVLAEAAPSDAQLHATKPAVAHELVKQQHRGNAKHHPQRASRREHASKAVTH
jgi:hypothetical protein